MYYFYKIGVGRGHFKDNKSQCDHYNLREFNPYIKTELEPKEEFMNRRMILLAITAIALATLACSININLPSTQVKTGPTETQNISVPFLSDKQAVANVTLQYGAGTLTLQPATGTPTELISGIAKFNVADLKPVVTTNNSDITIEQGDLKITGIPTINSKVVNDWNLSLANAPMKLVIKAGAYEGTYELGGLSIQSLNVTDGAAKVNLSFSDPNLIQMSSLQYTTGASEVTLKGLANAYTNDMTFRGGAGNYTLDFTGELRANMTVTIESGISQVTIIVPEGVNAQVVSQTGLMAVSTSGGWQQQGNNYSLNGSGNTITISVKMGAGNLKLETSPAAIK
jgi:hypothetical protein